jgi:2',3'-cyclic-nucleotide 2'-phosphodiesterase/3'-nucleotidase/5'-nucleotidase
LFIGIAALVLLAGAGSRALADPPELSSVRGELQETSFGDVTTDALCAEANTVIGLAPAVSFKPGTIPGRGATPVQVAGLLQAPDDPWAVSRLTGAQIRQALERSLSRVPLPSNAFLQVSGLTVTYDPSKPREHRVIDVTSAQGPLEPDQQYEVVMPLYLAKGGSGYFQIFGKDDIIRQGTSAVADAIYEYLQDHPGKSYTGQGRTVAGG